MRYERGVMCHGTLCDGMSADPKTLRKAVLVEYVLVLERKLETHRATRGVLADLLVECQTQYRVQRQSWWRRRLGGTHWLAGFSERLHTVVTEMWRT